MLGLALLAAPGVGHADYTTTLQSLAVSNHTGHVVDADAFKPAPPGRSVIAGSVSILYTRAGTIIAQPESVTYTLTWSLVDADGVAHPLDTGGTSLDTTQVVNWPGTISAIAMTSMVNLDPAAQLGFDKVYRLRVTATPASNGNATTYTDAVSRSYGHFTNTTSPDAPLSVIGMLVNPSINREWIITEGGLPGPTLSAPAVLMRYDDFDLPVASAAFDLRLRVTLKNMSAPVTPEVALANDTSVLNTAMANHSHADTPTNTAPVVSLVLQPTPLDRAAMYQATAVLDYQDAGGGYVALGSVVLPQQRIFPVTGVIKFGDVEARFTELAEVPTANGLNWNLTIPPAQGYILGKPGHTFGGSFVVSLDAEGNATVQSGTALVTTAAADIETVVNVRVKREQITLSSTGATAKVSVYFPAGFSISVPAAADGAAEKNAAGKAVFTGMALAGSALALPNPLPLTPLAVRQGVDPAAATSGDQFFCCHERLPAWFRASSVVWQRTGDPQVSSFAITAAGFDAWRWVREVEMAQTDAVNATITSAHLRDSRPSNERFLRNAAGAYPMESRSLGITVNAQGLAVVNARLPFGNGQAEPHYPQGTGPTAAVPGFAFGSGVLELVNGEVNAATSGVFGVTQIVQRYKQAPRGKKCPGNLDGEEGAFAFQPVGQTLRFTPELGLIAEGTLTPAELKWGTLNPTGPLFAHRTKEAFTQGSFYQPGFVLPGSVASALSANDRAGLLLLSGREKPGGTPEDLAYLERPGTTPFAAGLANYAGLNLRVGLEAAGMKGVSRMDNQDVEYTLKSNGKYHVQLGGVTGRHQRVGGGPALNVTFYGFPAQLTEYKLSFIDNQAHKSFTAGSVEIPFPVALTQPFAELRFNELGQPTSAIMPNGPQEHHLTHWGYVPFVAQTLAFHPKKSASACSPVNQKDGFIEMGALFTNLGGGIIPGSLTAPLGFKAVNGRGELITLTDSLPNGVAADTGIDSRLHLPTNLRVVVPGGGEYTLNPLTKGCFTASNNAPEGDLSGFLSFAGTLAVPFFKEMPVHAHLATTTQTLHLMGGWEEGGKTFFTNPVGFDPGHLGYPASITGNSVAQKLAAYRSPSDDAANDKYRTRAQKCWLDVVDFDFPLKWNATSRRFASVRKKQSDLLIFDIDSELKVLSGSGAEIGFGAELQQLPQFNLQRMGIDQMDGILGGQFEKFSNALADASAQALNATGITKAVKSLDDMITDRVDKVFEDALGAHVDLFLDAAFSNAEIVALQQAAATAEAQRSAVVTSLKNSLSAVNLLTARVQAAIGTVDSAEKSLLKHLGGAQGKLRDVLKGVQDLRKIIERDLDPPQGTGKRKIFRNLTANLAFSDPANGDLFVNGVNYLTQALDGLEEVQEFTDNPFFDELDAVLSTAEQSIQTALTLMDSRLGGPLRDMVSSVLAQPGFVAAIDSRITAALDRVLPAATSTLRDVAGPGPNEFRAQRLRNELRRAILDQVQASVLGDRIQGLLKTNFGDTREVVRHALDQITGQIATSVKEAFQQQIVDGVAAGLQNPLNGLAAEAQPILEFGKTLEGADLRGYARTAGSSIAALRLDGGIKMSPPGMGTGMEFGGYFEFKDNHLTGAKPDGCLTLGGLNRHKAIEVRAGASFGSKARPGKAPDGGKGTSGLDDMHVSLDVGFAFTKNGPLGFIPVGMTGTQHFKGEIELGIITLKEIKFDVNFSQQNQFLLAYANGKIVKILDADVWIFAGHTCDLAGMKTGDGPKDFLLDEYTNHALVTVLGTKFPGGIQPQNVTGVLMKTIGTISLNQLINEIAEVDIPSDVLELSFSRGHTYFYGVSAANGLNLDFLASMSMFGGLHAKLFGYEAAGAEVGISGALRAGLTDWLSGFPAVGLGISGKAEFEALEGLMETTLEVKGSLSRDGLTLEPPFFDPFELPFGL